MPSGVPGSRKSGVYIIRNKINGFCYIGSSIDIVQRWWHHKITLRQGKNRSVKLQKDFNELGEDSLEFEILEEVSKDRDLLISREQYWLDNFNPEYNSSPSAKFSHAFSHSKKQN